MGVTYEDNNRKDKLAWYKTAIATLERIHVDD